jgi:hypothetical protein
METRKRSGMPVAVVIFVVLVALACGLPVMSAAQTQSAVPVNFSPALPAEDDAILVTADVIAQPDAAAVSFNIVGNQIELYADQAPVSPVPPGVLKHLQWQLPALPAGSYTASVSLPGVPNVALVVRPRTAQLGLVGSRFQVTLADHQTGATPAAVQLSDSGGYFTFFDPANIELTIKIVDGRALNGHFWVFVASMTDTPLSLTVTDTQAGGGCGTFNNCPSHTYTNPPHVNQNFIDVAAF